MPNDRDENETEPNKAVKEDEVAYVRVLTSRAGCVAVGERATDRPGRYPATGNCWIVQRQRDTGDGGTEPGNIRHDMQPHFDSPL